jgi:predicted outer membrane repeat protein
MEKDHLVIARKPGLKCRTLYRVAAVGIATLITQASPGGAASSWGVECLNTNLANNSYCVTSLLDDLPSDDAAWTLRKSVEDANSRAVTSATIGFQDALFGIQRDSQGQVTNNSQTPLVAAGTPENPGDATNPTTEKKIVLDSTLEIKTNITITAPTDSGGSPLLTIVRGDSVASGAPLIAINPTADSHPATPTTGPAANQATTEVRIENVNIQARTNTENPQGSGFAGQTKESANPGVTIQVKETIEVTPNLETTVTPTVVLVNTTISNAVSESGGAAISTPGDVTLINSTLTGNVAAQSGNAVAQDGGAIKADGTVNVISSALNGNTASGNGGAISATTVIVSTAAGSSNSQLNNNTAGGSGGAISVTGTVTVAQADISGNTATNGNGGGISAAGSVSVTDSNLDSNKSLNPISNSSGVTPVTGGGAISAGGNVTVTSAQESTTPATLSKNTSTTNGGAITAGGSVTISGIKAEENNAGFSGGVISAGGDVGVSPEAGTPVQTIMSNNEAAVCGGAISAAGSVTISGLKAEENTAGFCGGAIEALGGVSISGSELKSNSTLLNGGAIIARGAVTVSTSTLNSNTSEQGSGGAVSTVGAVTVSASTLNSNTATLGSGGAISTLGAVTVSESSTVSSNIAKENGGAISALGAVTVFTSTLNSNTAEGSGGAISTRGEVTVSASTLNNNTATLGSGGAISTVVSVTVFETSTVSSNTAKESGGAIKAGGEVTVSSSTLNNNTVTVGSGGAISALAGVAIFDSSTVSSNTAKENGGAISAGGEVTVSASTLNYNVATEGSGGAISAEGTVTISNSEFTENEAGYQGGAISSASEVITTKANNPSEKTYFIYNLADFGGAIYAGDSVKISDANFENNDAAEIGGAILIDSESQDKSSINDSTFEGNYGGFAGGAIFGNEAKLVINNSDFLNNVASVVGGAITHGGDLEIAGSTFTGNIASANDEEIQDVRDECQEEDGSDKFDCLLMGFLGVDGSLDQGMGMGDIYGLAGGGAIRVFDADEYSSWMNDSDENQNLEAQTHQQTVIIQDSGFSQNSAHGDGGAIYFLGLLQILGSRFEENWALPALHDFGFENGVRGSGGAVRGAEIEITSSSFDSNFASLSGGAVYAEDGLEIFESLPQPNKTHSTEFENNFALGDIYSDSDEAQGGGGAIATNSASVIGALFANNETYVSGGAIFLFGEELTVKDSTFDGNEAFGNGGAIFSLGDLSISGSTFGSALPPDLNPDYNPATLRENPEYDPNSFQFQTMTNPQCANQPWFGFDDDFCEIDGIEYPWSVPNPDYQPEYFYDLEDETKDQDDYKYNYGGNYSGNGGGAIYVQGQTSIKDSTFNGNMSDGDGGAISSEGALEIKDSSFNRNWAEYDGGAISTTPEDGDLFITRTAFIENVAMDDGGAIDISTGPVAHYDDVILSSLFRGNEAFGSGGAIDSAFVVLILNTFEDNTDPQGATLDIGGGALSGNVLIGSSNDGDLCSIYDFVEAADNFATDSSCFESGQPELNTLLSRDEITSEEELHILPEGYGVSILQAFQSQQEFFLDPPSDSNPEGVLAPLGDFITQELNKDFDSQVRESTLSWTAGHLQRILPEPPVAPEVDNSVVDKGEDKPKETQPNPGSNNQVVITPPSSNNAEAPVLILERVLSSDEIARIAQQRAEQLAAELKRQQEAERAAAERLAKIKADKLARDKARALAAEKRRAQLAALKAKIAATQARGEALKQKNSWINLMKDFSKSAQGKKLVNTPVK